MAELLARKPLFPGKDYVQQLDLIIKVRPAHFKPACNHMSQPKAVVEPAHLSALH
jgi:hypothetical protein